MPRVHRVRLALLDPTGEPAITAQIDEAGDPMFTVGPRDSGAAVVVTARSVDVWRSGDAVVSVTAGEEGGRVEVLDAE